jgi:hypothetical protein
MLPELVNKKRETKNIKKLKAINLFDLWAFILMIPRFVYFINPDHPVPAPLIGNSGEKSFHLRISPDKKNVIVVVS